MYTSCPGHPQDHEVGIKVTAYLWAVEEGAGGARGLGLGCGPGPTEVPGSTGPRTIGADSPRRVPITTRGTRVRHAIGAVPANEPEGGERSVKATQASSASQSHSRKGTAATRGYTPQATIRCVTHRPASHTLALANSSRVLMRAWDPGGVGVPARDPAGQKAVGTLHPCTV
jgi:hypothetical protein